jgi:DNA polymerase-3 subunit delta
MAAQAATPTFEDIIRDLKNKVYFPVYFLQGEEPYYIDKLADFIAQHVLTADEKEFNQTVVYGKETDALSIMGIAKRYPMMSNHQVIIIKEAQDVKDLDKIISYVEQPLVSTLLVLCYKYKTLDKRTSFAKAIASKGILFSSIKLYDNKIPSWIGQYVSSRQYKINQKACFLLGEYLGNDLSKITNELDKLMLNVPPTTEINNTHIEEYVGISKDYNVFELQNAIGKRDVLKANKIVNYFTANPKDNPLVVTLSTLYGYFTKILIYHALPDKSQGTVASELKVSPYFVNDYETSARVYSVNKIEAIISDLRHYDLMSKGVDAAGIPEGQLLQELIFKILH